MFSEIQTDWFTLFSAVLATLAISGLWVNQTSRTIAFLPFAGSLLLAILAQRISATGLTFGAIFLLLVFSYVTLDKKLPAKMIENCVFLAIVMMGALLGAHQLQGFVNWQIFYNLQLSEGARPYSLYFNLDKTLVGFGLLWLAVERCRTVNDWKIIARSVFYYLPVLLLVTVPLGIMFGYVKFDLKFPEITPIWLIANLLMTSVSEEVFFRGFLQTELQRRFGRYSKAGGIAVLITSLLFGLAHFGGGWRYVILAAVAGGFYGWIFFKTKKIEASIALHFSLNTFHFFFLTYPSL